MAPPRASSVPLSLVATPSLAGATVGRQVRLAVGPGWHERPAIWTALITLTGIGKTRAIGIALPPFDILQAEARSRWRAKTAAWRLGDHVSAVCSSLAVRSPAPARPIAPPFSSS